MRGQDVARCQRPHHTPAGRPRAARPAPASLLAGLLLAASERMVALARDRAVGAHTYHVTVAHTAQAREILGPDRFLAVEHAVLFETDPDRARAIAREHLHPYLTTPLRVAKFRRLGTPTTRSRVAAVTASSTTSCSGVNRTRSPTGCGHISGRAPTTSPRR